MHMRIKGKLMPDDYAEAAPYHFVGEIELPKQLAEVIRLAACKSISVNEAKFDRMVMATFDAEEDNNEESS
ncbi:MAG: hypothetical protein AMJ55_00315 [Gammaproteobacteria bacterium SG8_15]|nr:MAG: hypothetical protein AMJ55_00315 [Gammaproteobacteria bacterium SG8_15]